MKKNGGDQMDTLKIHSEPFYIEFDKDGKFLTKF